MASVSEFLASLLVRPNMQESLLGRLDEVWKPQKNPESDAVKSH